MSKKKPQKTEAQRDKRKVRSGAMHKNQEELSMERSKAFAKQVEKVGRAGFATVIVPAKAPWLYPKVLLHTIPAKKKVVS